MSNKDSCGEIEAPRPRLAGPRKAWRLTHRQRESRRVLRGVPEKMLPLLSQKAQGGPAVERRRARLARGDFVLDGELVIFITSWCTWFADSNWEWARACGSESVLSLKMGLQSAVWELGGVPLICQSDNSSTATHVRGRVGRGREYIFMGRKHQKETIPWGTIEEDATRLWKARLLSLMRHERAAAGPYDEAGIGEQRCWRQCGIRQSVEHRSHGIRRQLAVGLSNCRQGHAQQFRIL